MNRLLATATIGLCAFAAPAMAQAVSTANPCAIGDGFQGNVSVSHMLINVGVGGGAARIYDSAWCPYWQQATLLYTACHSAPVDPDKCKAADQLMCAIPTMPAGARRYLHCDDAPVALAPQIPQQAPQPVAPINAVMPAAEYTHPAPVQVVASTEPHPAKRYATSVAAEPCRIPDGVPASQWSGCWAR